MDELRHGINESRLPGLMPCWAASASGIATTFCSNTSVITIGEWPKVNVLVNLRNRQRSGKSDFCVVGGAPGFRQRQPLFPEHLDVRLNSLVD